MGIEPIRFTVVREVEFQIEPQRVVSRVREGNQKIMLQCMICVGPKGTMTRCALQPSA